MDVPVLSGVLAALLLVVGAAIALTGSLGLLRLRSFYQRVHSPTLGTTLGTTFVALASIVHFSALATRPVVHELLIIVFVTVTTPISLLVLVRAAVFRDGAENEAAAPGRLDNGHR
jgi:multicomponent K+:H+ antiporter subunit G